jgi:general secretion pathway protein A
MYETFYSLSGMPFQLTPDDRFFFGSQQHRKALAFLQYGIAQEEGFVVVTGEIGAGKTTLLQHLLSNLDSTSHVAGRVVTTQLGGYDMLYMIASAFGIASENLDKGALIERVNQVFAGIQAEGKRPLVIIDEAQSLTTEAIEELRMLSNLTLNARAPFQGILLGQPEFRATLASPQLQQFRQRVIASCHLDALNAEDTRSYIEHRLKHVGWAGDPAFADDAFDTIYRYTDGVPRRINTLCSRLLLLGYLEERHTIDSAGVESVAEELANEVGPLEQGSGVIELGNGEAVPQLARKEVSARLARLEYAIRTHENTINQLIEVALKYLPAQDAE